MGKTLYGKIIWRNFLILFFAILTLSLAASWVMLYYGIERTNADNSRVALLAAQRIENFIDLAGERTRTAGEILSASLEKDWPGLLPDIFGLANVFDLVALVSKEGKVQALYPGANERPASSLVPEELFRTILAGENLAISEPVPGKEKGGFLITFASPVKNARGQVVAVLCCSFDFPGNRFFQGLFNQLQNGLGGYGYLVDSQGRILMHPDQNRLLEDVSGNIAVGEVIRGKSGRANLVNSKGIRMLASYVPIRRVNWGIVVQDPLNSVLRPLAMLMEVLLLALPVLLGLAFFVNHLLIKEIIKPIHELERGMRLAARGNLAQQLAVTGDDEISSVARSFNSMLAQLEKLREGERQSFEELSNAEKMAAIGELAAGTAHEIRNPLTSIKGFIQMMEQYDLPEHKRREYLKIIREEIKSIENITGDFLALAKPRPEQFQKTDLEQLLQEVVDLLAYEAFIHGITVKTGYTGIPPVKGDHGQLKQVFMNLMKNALEATPRGGVLKVRTYWDREEGQGVVEIEDQGKGIAPEVLKKLGQPFVTTKEQGTGLGLTVSFRIIQNHGGSIDYITGPQGTTFFIKLPMPKEKTEPEENRS